MSSEITDILLKNATMNIETALAELGLEKNKGAVYLATLEIGKGSVIEIAKKVGLPRTTVHEILQHLLALGLVNFTVHGKRRIYIAERPEKLKSLLNEKNRILQSILPELGVRFNSISGTKPRVSYYEGLNGIKTVFDDTLTVTDKLLIGVLSMEDLYQVPGKEYMDEYVKRRVSNGIKLKVIRSDVKEVEEIWPSSNDEKRELHYAPQGFVFPMTVYLYDNKVSIISTKKENFGMIVESADLYQTMKNFFEIVWQVSRATRKKD